MAENLLTQKFRERNLGCLDIDGRKARMTPESNDLVSEKSSRQKHSLEK